MSSSPDNVAATGTETQAEAVRVPVIEEQARISVRRVETGRRFRVRKVVREHERNVEAEAWREDIEVERRRIDRPIDAPVAIQEEDGVTIIPVVAERVTLQRQQVLVEEIRITRRRRTETRVMPVTLRSEQAIVEQYDPASDSWSEIDASGRA